MPPGSPAWGHVALTDRRCVMATSTSTRARPLEVLRTNRNLRVLLGSLSVSGLGDWMYGIAVATWVLERTHSPAMVGVTVAVRLAPFALLGAAGGVAADRFDRRRLLAVLDWSRAAVLLLLVAIIA